MKAKQGFENGVERISINLTSQENDFLNDILEEYVNLGGMYRGFAERLLELEIEVPEVEHM